MNLTHPTFGTIVWLVWACSIVGSIVYQSFRKDKQTSELKNHLEVLNFYPGKLPASLPLRSLAPKLSSPNLVLTGTYNGCNAVVGKARVGQGKGSYTQSFVAVEKLDETPYRSPAFLTYLQFEYHQHGRWILGTVDKQTLDLDAVKGFLDCLT